jgi:hypothetical protein
MDEETADVIAGCVIWLFYVAIGIAVAVVAGHFIAKYW